MTQDQVLRDKVGEVRFRIRLLVTQQWICTALTVSLVTSLLLVLATKMRWWTDAIDYLWALLLVGAAIGFGIGWTRRISPLVAAQVADERGGLKERLSTAVELAASPNRSHLAEAQISDAIEHAKQLRVSEVLPWRAPRQLKFLAAAAVVLLAAIFVPELPLFHSKQDRLDAEVMKQEGTRLQKLAKSLEKKVAEKKEKDSNDEIMRRVAKEMQKLGKDQARTRISKKQALLAMNDLQKQIKEEENKIAGGPAGKSMDKVSSDLKAAADRQKQQGAPDGGKALKQMADNLDKKDFDAAKKQLEELAKKIQSGTLKPEEAKQLADTMEKMAASMAGSNLDKASEELKEAASKLQEAAKQAQKFQQQMAQAKTDAERQQLQQQMQQALQQGAQQAAQQCNQAGGT